MSIFVTDKIPLTKRIEAEEAYWTGTKGTKGIWKLKNVIVYDLEKGNVTRSPEMDYPYLESPDFFSKG